MSSAILAIIQARRASSRLSGKVLLDIAGQPMLVRVVERTRRARTITRVVVATTTELSDDPVEALCVERGYPCYRGSQYDVLDRYYQAARNFGAEIIVRITADCPVIDPGVIDKTVGVFLYPPNGVSGMAGVQSPLAVRHLPFDFVANRLPQPWSRTVPIGLDVEVCSFIALEQAWKEADQPFHREHVMPYFYEGVPPEALQPSGDISSMGSDAWYVVQAVSQRGFSVAQLHHFPDYGSLRWTVDTPADLELLRQVYARFPDRDDFSWLDVLALFKREPELAQINANVKHKTAFDVDTRR
jgi:spore coat polysaccharide biosynthesis protein SpsF